MKSGTKITVTITLDAEVVTELDDVTAEQVRLLFFSDSAYGLKSCVFGRVETKSRRRDETYDDTEITWNSTTIDVKEMQP